MTLETFFANFGYLAEAPNGVQKLRELILYLAVQGKLVPQDPNDEPASVLLARIKAEKERFVKEKKIRKAESLPPVCADEVPYELPRGWNWVRLGEVGETNIGLTYTPTDLSEIGIPVLRSNNIQNGKLDLSDLKRVETEIKDNVLAKEGDLLICARNGSRALVGKAALIPRLSEEMAFGAFMAIFRSIANPYLLVFISSKLFRKMIDEVNTMTINQLTQNNLKTTIFPLPPLAEQQRIVAKVDELMALCDELEEQQQRSRAKLTRLNNSALDRLLNARDTVAFSAAWHLVHDNFDALYTTPETITKLRQAILQLAVQGKLVPQDPNDEPASILLARIKAEKERLVKEKKIKKADPLPPIGASEVPYQLPTGWEWDYIQTVTKLVTDGEHATPPRILQGVPMATAKNIRDGFVDLNDTDYVSLETAEKCWKRCDPQLNDVLMVCVGATTGRLSIVKSNTRFVLVRSVALIRPFSDFLAPDYLALLLKSPLGQAQIWGNVKQSAQPCLYIHKINSIRIPLPPLAEQRRIVAKMGQLLAICDELEAKLTKSQTKGEKLASAAVKGLVAARFQCLQQKSSRNKLITERIHTWQTKID